MKAIIYLLTAMVVICDLLFVALVVASLGPEPGANMILMVAPLVVCPSLIVSSAIIFWLNRAKEMLAMHRVIYRFHGASFFGCLAICLFA